MRCKPGEMCLIISEMPGCEANIGAYVTVTKSHNVPKYGDVWEFEDASRPLVLTNGLEKVSHSYDKGVDGAFLRDCDLLPIRDLDKVEIEERDLEAV